MKAAILALLTLFVIFPADSQSDSAITTQGLVAYYPFSGNANDSSGNSFNATIVGATLTSNRFGVANNAYSFNGDTSIISYGDILDSVFSAPIAQFSVSGWAMTRTCGSMTYGGGFIIGKNGGGNLGPYQWNITHEDGVLYAAVFSDTLAQNYIALTSPMGTYQWFHFVLVFDGSQPEMQRIKLYVNGDSSSATVFQHIGTLGTTTVNSEQPLTIGATYHAKNSESSSNFYDGDIDDIRIYDRVLSGAEVQALYHEGGWSTLVHPGLVAYYPFNGDANDSSGNGFNPTIVRAAPTTDRFGVQNSSFSFDGYSSIINCGDILDSVLSAPIAKFSVSGWAMTRTFGSALSGGGFIIGKNGGGNLGPYQWNITHEDGVLYGAVFSDTLAQNYIALTSPMGVNQWFHFVLVFDGSLPETQRVKLYVNGRSSNTTVFQHVGTLGTATVNSQQPLTIGATLNGSQPDSPAGNFYNGDVDDIRIYNWPLDSATIQSLYHQGGWPKPLQPGLVAYYPFNGNANDLSGNGFNGTVINATSAPDRFNHANSAYYFNGSNSYINLGDILDTVFAADTAQFSVSGWAKTIIPGSQAGGGGFIIGKEGGGNAGIYEWGLNHYVDNNVYANIFYDGYVGRYLQITSTPVQPNNWFHFVYVYNGFLQPTERLKLYINTTITPTITANVGTPGTGTLNTAQPLTIGAGLNLPNSPNNFYNGYIDDIRIYNRVVTANEIDSLYHEGGWIDVQPNLVAYYPLNGNANDSSGNGFNATVVGATPTADRFGASNGAYSFNDSSSIIRCGDILDSIFAAPVAKFTVSGWARTRTYGTTNGGGGFIVGKNAGGGTQGPAQWNITHLDGLLYGAVFSDTLAQNYIALTSPMGTNQWFHFALVFDGSQPEMQRIKLYVNGRTTSTTVFQHIGTLGTATISSKQEITIGASYQNANPVNPTNSYNGDIDDIRIYNYVLDSTAIQVLFHQGGWATTNVGQFQPGIPDDFELLSNYPNPFNPSTTIRFGIPERSFVKIEIFNILGQRVAAILNGEVEAGYYQKEWQANSASGVYFYRIEATSLSDPSKRFVAAKKMLLVK
ncbi:MAG TPA: LamG-like jellyroll fold domain-containing protein [Bacteroidota bacterium]|nr:LamG-like jellyroll fold domain-containing protein [Bacteroidota bacterium]